MADESNDKAPAKKASSKKASGKSSAKRASKKSGRSAASKSSAQPGNPQMMDKLLRDINRALESHEFASEREMNEFINLNFTGKKIGTFTVPNASPLDQAQDKIYEAYDARTDKERVRLAREALELSPDCADAYVMLGSLSQTPEQALKFYEQGVEAGRRAIGEREFREFEEDEAFWGFIETRPYMRARFELADVLWVLERHDEAVEHYEALLKLNPNDNQGIRYIFAQALLKLERHERLAALLEQYMGDGSATWKYTNALLAYRQEGDSPRAKELLAAAFEANPHVPMTMIMTEKLPPPPDYVGFGDLNEAVAYIYEGLENWMTTPHAIEWMLSNFTSNPANISNAVLAMLPSELINLKTPKPGKSAKKKKS